MVRHAVTSDAEAICVLLNHYAEQGKMLHRSLESVYESLRDFHVCHENGEIAGCAALSISWKRLGEIRSLAVAPKRLGEGIGRRLVEHAIGEGKSLGLNRIFVLTYEPDFFERFGFGIVEKESLPTKVWRDCLHCPRAETCDEIAMILQIDQVNPES